VTGEYLSLVKFDGYVAPSKPLDGTAGDRTMATPKIEWHIFSDAATRVTTALAGDMDIVFAISHDNISQFKDNKNVKLDKGQLAFWFVVPNKKQGISADKNFRLALNYAIDVDEVSKAQFPAQEYVEITSSYMPKMFATWYTNVADDLFNQYDVAKAKQYLAASSYAGQPVNLCVQNQNPLNSNACLVVAEYMKATGINVNLVSTDYATWLKNITNPEIMDVYVSDLPPGAIPPSLRFLSPTRTGWTQLPDLQDLLNQMNAASKVEDAQALWKQAQRLASENANIIPLGYAFNLNAVKTTVENYDPSGENAMWKVKVRE
jgi:peptide/nickel transport system substrate-binding protein